MLLTDGPAQNSQERPCLSLSLDCKRILRHLKLGTSNCHPAIMKRGPIWKGSHSEASRATRWRKRILSTSYEFLDTFGHNAWLFESLSSVRKTFPFSLKLIWIVFLSFAGARVLPTPFFWLTHMATWNYPSHRKQDSWISEWGPQHNLLPLESIILLYSIHMSPVEV